MAYIRKRKGSWQCIVRVQGYPQMTKTFKTKIDAVRFSRDLENKRLEEQRKKIFKKKQSDENIGGLAYLLNTYK